MTILNWWALEIIKKHFEDAKYLFDSLPQEQRDSILLMHEENYSLNHCLRRWLQALEEILSD